MARSLYYAFVTPCYAANVCLVQLATFTRIRNHDVNICRTFVTFETSCYKKLQRSQGSAITVSNLQNIRYFSNIVFYKVATVTRICDHGFQFCRTIVTFQTSCYTKLQQSQGSAVMVANFAEHSLIFKHRVLQSCNNHKDLRSWLSIL